MSNLAKKLDELTIRANMQMEYVRGMTYAINEFQRRCSNGRAPVDIVSDMRKPIDDRLAKTGEIGAWESGYMDYTRQIHAAILESDIV